jgi:hypothetical protein
MYIWHCFHPTEKQFSAFLHLHHYIDYIVSSVHLSDQADVVGKDVGHGRQQE